MARTVRPSAWGNEPDVFRYAKPGRTSWWNVPTIAVSYFLGAFLFPIMGYLVAVVSGKSDFSESIRYFATFTVFGLAGVMMLILLVNQWAVQDGNLYIGINGAQNLLSRIPGWRRQYTVIGLGVIAALLPLRALASCGYGTVLTPAEAKAKGYDVQAGVQAASPSPALAASPGLGATVVPSPVPSSSPRPGGPRRAWSPQNRSRPCGPAPCWSTWPWSRAAMSRGPAERGRAGGRGQNRRLFQSAKPHRRRRLEPLRPEPGRVPSGPSVLPLHRPRRDR